ncbi:MAG TPA: hypothetical protein VGO33_15935 [Gemmatimonadaceae bacterium]|jgi:hypothetical protein|nr:hypothetical protein [Gemmatimonadaceae bacterium]
MAFSIRLLPEKVPESEIGNTGQYGEIQLGGHCETFVALIGFWSPLDYTQHWSHSIKRLLDLKRESCLITSIHEPRAIDVIHWWLLYPFGEDVIVQNSLLLGKKALADFDTRNPYRTIPARREISAEGEQISEWIVRMTEFRDFLDEV